MRTYKEQEATDDLEESWLKGENSRLERDVHVLHIKIEQIQQQFALPEMFAVYSLGQIWQHMSDKDDQTGNGERDIDSIEHSFRRRTKRKCYDETMDSCILSGRGDKAAPADESLSLKASERSMSSLLASEWYCYGYSSGLKRGNHWFDSVTRCGKVLPPTAMVCMEGP
ncbi:hypothetical protein Q7C36_000503 [Tachysurus vachellii]|uniref:Uncharacterized protein n=1 Tax=Tachysurus vachellii TaxID=175792 RepID=A0AA88P1I5_TACVA|nr:hypothetical protein Q7C36_000503 [Tachysurus vachellii]